MSVKKIGERTNILKQQAFTLCQIKPNQILPPEMQKTDQSILPAFLLCLKRTTHKPLKVAAAKSISSSVYVTGTTCFDECFLFYVIAARNHFLFKVNSYSETFEAGAFFEANVLKEVRILCVFSTISIWCL